MAVTSLLAPGPKAAAAAAAGRPQTRGSGDQTTPGSARRSTSAGGSRSSGGARDAGGARAWCCLAYFFFPRPGPLQIAALGGFPASTRADSLLQGGPGPAHSLCVPPLAPPSMAASHPRPRRAPRAEPAASTHVPSRAAAVT
ncbi:translation initiation factor IF-2-like [Rhinolophus ferrumequinum]|uniref:translation initiation factor IF-2-like n=1 Tax=Rhinolophus ferrumequinum TaxID=59479 RepID=UPI00140F88DD|nr:translation initiation factor IF-2-like [Rhinolophus ferrumequinum]